MGGKERYEEEREGARSPERLQREAAVALIASTAVSPRDAEARREPPKGLFRCDSQSPLPEAPPGQRALRRPRVCTCSVRYSAARLWPRAAGTWTRGWRAGLGRAGQGSARERQPRFPGRLRWMRGSAKGRTGCDPRGCGAR